MCGHRQPLASSAHNYAQQQGTGKDQRSTLTTQLSPSENQQIRRNYKFCFCD